MLSYDPESMLALCSKLQQPTLLLQVVNSASCCVFAAVGQGKADMMKRLLGEEAPADPRDLPARMVRPGDGELVWFLDTSAAQHL